MLNDLCFIQNVENKLKNYIYYIKNLIFRLKYIFNFLNLNKFEIHIFLFLYGSCILSKL